MIPQIDPNKQKLVKCAAGCGRHIAVSKYAPNTQTCVPCGETPGPKLSAPPRREADRAAAAIFGTSEDPRQDVADIQSVLRSLDFTPAPGGEWHRTVATHSGIARATVKIDQGLAMAPDPVVTSATVVTQTSIPLAALDTYPVAWRPTELLDSLKLLAQRLGVRQEPPPHNHIIRQECDDCGEESAEFWSVDGRVVCLRCARRSS